MSLSFQEFKDLEGRVHIELRTELSSFVIESAERSDESTYNIVVTNPVGEDKATLIVKVVGKKIILFSISIKHFTCCLMLIALLTWIFLIFKMSQTHQRMFASPVSVRTGQVLFGTLQNMMVERK